ncbi:hypothetical protein MWU78_19730 [Arenibacter sp. F26102]|uniref:FKBP-type peptidyl-prolyl cis-trans isomerase n=1 Tax=Arenibacter sp. F26102 TaxID=2926416 RepID=UPI001FF2B953|nr:FKBP-type peptidyl-prolyl cis-trans isomerase [Arenibacter sp. F26102]MCK0147888.1 hypothetical protein [Arenibacter sp. F26102]
MTIKRILLLTLIFVAIWSCKKDDGNDIEVIPPRLLSEVAVENDAEIQAYLKTHFYNYEDFVEPIDEGFDLRIKLDTIAGANADKKSLFEDAETQVIKISSSDLGLDAGEVDIEHTLYYVVAREGVGENPTPVDSVYLKYQGMRLDGNIFDSRLGAPVWFDMQGSGVSGNSGVIKGFKEGMPKFKSGGEIIENGDGTFTVTGSGVGLIFMPSGIAYFSGSAPGASYAPLIFEVNLLATNTSDHDRDGVDTILEDLNKDGNLFNDDTDEDGIPNYLDTDDDGDGILTEDEIKDANNDGVPDYLDKNI